MRLERERKELEAKMALRIQAWWRMIMVRRFLGVFKRMKKQKVSTSSKPGEMNETPPQTPNAKAQLKPKAKAK